MHRPYPVPTIAHLRVQAFSNLAYGAKTIQYFTYWTFRERRVGLQQRADRARRSCTPVYDLVKQVNAEIQNVARAFAGSKVVAVGHTGERLPAGTKRYEPAAPVAAVETEGDGAVVSLLSNESKRYLVVVNRDINKPMPVTIRLDGSKKVERSTRRRRPPFAAPAVQERVEPGDVLILSWERRGIGGKGDGAVRAPSRRRHGRASQNSLRNTGRPGDPLSRLHGL